MNNEHDSSATREPQQTDPAMLARISREGLAALRADLSVTLIKATFALSTNDSSRDALDELFLESDRDDSRAWLDMLDNEFPEV